MLTLAVARAHPRRVAIAIRYPLQRLLAAQGGFDGPAIAAPIVGILAALTGRSWELRGEVVDSVEAPEDIGQPWIVHRFRWKLRAARGRRKAELELLLAETALNMSYQDYDVYRATLRLADGRVLLVDGAIAAHESTLLCGEGFTKEALLRACAAASVPLR